jgi:hypothetical protein
MDLAVPSQEEWRASKAGRNGPPRVNRLSNRGSRSSRFRRSSVSRKAVECDESNTDSIHLA